MPKRIPVITRLLIALSAAMFALFAARYNFVRPHSTLKTTPAAGLVSDAGTIVVRSGEIGRVNQTPLQRRPPNGSSAARMGRG